MDIKEEIIRETKIEDRENNLSRKRMTNELEVGDKTNKAVSKEIIVIDPTHTTQVQDKGKVDVINKSDDFCKIKMIKKENDIIQNSVARDKQAEYLYHEQRGMENESSKCDEKIKEENSEQNEIYNRNLSSDMDLSKTDYEKGVLNNVKETHSMTLNMTKDLIDVDKEMKTNETMEPMCSKQEENDVFNYLIDNNLLVKKATKRQGIPCSFPGCKKNFSRPDKLEKHLLIHSNVREFICGMISCGKAYTTAQHLRRHHATAHAVRDTSLEITPDSVLGMVPCDEATCSRRFQSKLSMTKHYQKIHLNARARYTCEICFTSFFYQAEYYKHMYEEHGVKLLMCDKCDLIFSSKTDLNRHMRGHRIWVCEEPQCYGIFFEKYTEKRRHDAIVHPILYICHHCNFQAQRKFFLEEHMYSKHLPSSERPMLSCTYANCNKTFHHERNYLQHYKKKHLHESTLFICPVGCPQTFATKQSCQRHVTKMHQGVDGSFVEKAEPDLPFSCEYCPKKFGKLLNVRRHVLRVHIQHPRRVISKIVTSVIEPHLPNKYIPIPLNKKSPLVTTEVGDKNDVISDTFKSDSDSSKQNM